MMNDNAVNRFLADVINEHVRAVTRFPGPNLNLAALTEEAGELAEAMAGYLVTLQVHHGRLARAMLHHRPNDGGNGTWDQVRKEAVQVAVMALRVALEGDPTIAAAPAEYTTKNRADDAEHERSLPEIRFHRFPTGGWKAVPHTDINDRPMSGAWDLLRWDATTHTWDGIRRGVNMVELLAVVMNVKLPANPWLAPADQQQRDLERAESYRQDDAARQALQDARDAEYKSNDHRKPEFLEKNQPFDETQPGGICHMGHEWWFLGKGDGSKRCERCGLITGASMQPPATPASSPPQDEPQTAFAPPEFRVRHDSVKVATTRPPAGIQPPPASSPVPSDFNPDQHAITNALSCLNAIAAAGEMPGGGEQHGNYAHVMDAISWLTQLQNKPALAEPITPLPVLGTCKIVPRTGADTFDVQQWNGKTWTEIAGDVSAPFARGIFERRMKEAGLHSPGDVDPDTGAPAANADLRKGIIKQLRDKLYGARTQARFILVQANDEKPDLDAIRQYAECILSDDA